MRYETFHDTVDFQAMVAGDGPTTIVFVHGFPDTLETWQPVFERLLERRPTSFRLVAIPLPGWCGGYRQAQLPMNVLAPAVSHRIASVTTEPVIYVGHDWGSVIGWSLAAHHPEQLERAMLVSVPPLPRYLRNGLVSAKQFWRARYVFGFQVPALAEFRLEHTDYVADLWDRWSAAPPPAVHVRRVVEEIGSVAPTALAYYRGLRRLAFDRQLWRYVHQPARCDVLGVFGLRETCVGPELWRGADRWAGASFRAVSFDEAGHWPQWDTPDELVDLIEKFACTSGNP